MIGDIYPECFTPNNKDEAWCASMCESMICYGNGLGSCSDRRYLTEYNETLGRERVVEIYNTIKEYINRHYDIVDMGKDFEGLSYKGFQKKSFWE